MVCKVDRILSKVWLRYKFNSSLRMILELDVPGSKQKYGIYSERRIVLPNPVSYKKSASEILRWYGQVVIDLHITMRSFWCKQLVLPSQATREASKERFIYLPQYDTWMTSRARYSVFFNKQPWRLSAWGTESFPSKVFKGVSFWSTIPSLLQPAVQWNFRA